jgi:hypothetical protein
VAAAGQDNLNAEELELMMISMDMTIISDDYPKILGCNLKNPSSDQTVSSFNRVRLQVFNAAVTSHRHRVSNHWHWPGSDAVAAPHDQSPPTASLTFILRLVGTQPASWQPTVTIVTVVARLTAAKNHSNLKLC